MTDGERTARLSRRRLLAAGGAAALLGAARTAAGSAATAAEQKSAAAVPFFGEHQAGITTPQQSNIVFASFRSLAPTATDLAVLLSAWTNAAGDLTRGIGLPGTSAPGVMSDTGEAAGIPASRLTLTFGFGPSLFDGRYGLAGKLPDQLAPLPAFRGDALEIGRTGGDLCVQACADDPQVALHAVRNLARIGAGRAEILWLQRGFLHRPPPRDTPRNLMGFHDGTANLDPRDPARMARNVWAGPESPAWMQGGTYLVARRIRIHIEKWDAEQLEEQQRAVGREKQSGAPIGGVHQGDPVVVGRLDARSHVRLANPRTGAASEDERILRRGYNFADGLDSEGNLDAGLFFVAYQRDPRRQFVSIQRRLAVHDRLGEYLVHTGSGLFACPPGMAVGARIGSLLLE
ncbi:MAG TPA: Dyp-type peroxidase [Gaiellaceae bacterium]|nr:Dyp-type peroxidase [Gaiellaceae bacterium]